MAKQPTGERYDVIADLGNSLWKYRFLWMERGKQKHYEITIPHAILRDDTGESFRDVQARRSHESGIGDETIFMVDDVAYIVGDSAEASGLVTRLTGAAKYRRDYQGIALMAGLVHALPFDCDNIHLWISFPPGDVKATQDLIQSVGGRWRVQTVGKANPRYYVRTVQTFDEPLGAYTHASADRSGLAYEDSPVSGGNTLIVDVGGKISSVMRVTENQRVLYAGAQSVDLGIQDVMEGFWKIMRGRHPELLKLRSYDPALVREALRTGSYAYKGRNFDVEEEAQQAIMPILNRLMDFYENNFASGANDRHVLVTGGGGAVLYPWLQQAFGHHHMMPAEPHLDEMHLACVRGGAKMCLARNGS